MRVRLEEDREMAPDTAERKQSHEFDQSVFGSSMTLERHGVGETRGRWTRVRKGVEGMWNIKSSDLGQVPDGRAEA